MKSETTSHKLGAIINLIGGGTPKRNNPAFWGGDIPWLSVADFNTESRFVGTASENITKKGIEKSSTKLLEAGQLIISARGTVGALAQLTRPMAFNQSCYGIDAKKGLVDNDFLYYLIKEKVQELKTKTHGAVFDTITRETFNHIVVEIPSIETQRDIARILGDIDRKIEINRQINQTLEQSAQAIFKSWFVDFEPVKAKIEAKATGIDPERAAMRALSGKSDEELDQLPREQFDQIKTTAALFPDELVESKFGEIPKGWEVKPLDKIADYLNGLALQKFPPESETEFLPVIKIAQLRKGDTEGSDKASRNIKPTYIVQDGDVLFSWSGSLEVVIWCGGEGALNQHLFKVTSEAYPKWVYYLWTKHHLQSFRDTAENKATTMGHIQRKHLTEALCVVPSAKTLEGLGKFIEPNLELLIENRKQNKHLAETRDSLLPKLLSGEIYLSGSGATAEAAA